MQYVVQSARMAVVIVAVAFLLLALHSGVRAGSTASVFSADGVRWSLAALTAAMGLFVALVALHARFWERQPVPGAVPGVAAVGSLIGIGVLMLPTPEILPAVFSGLLVVVAVIYRNVPFLVIVWSAIGAIAGISTLNGDTHVLGVLLVVASLISGAKVIIDLSVAELHRQERMADHARRTATEFVAANVRLQNSLRRSESADLNSERRRIAREIHDTVGHSLTAVLVQLRTARELMRVRPGQVTAYLEEVEVAVRDALRETRQEVRSLREREPIQVSWQVRWRQLCMKFAECTGARVDLGILDDLGAVTDGVGETVFRVIQEALTNAIRHGRATKVDVRLRLKPTGQLLLRISDNGGGALHVQPGSGLRGMRERIDELRGEVAWETLPKRGFDLGIVIPAAAVPG